jgi:hypothetical protein
VAKKKKSNKTHDRSVDEEILMDLEDIEDAKKALKEASEKGTIPFARLKEELGLKDPSV